MPEPILKYKFDEKLDNAFLCALYLDRRFEKLNAHAADTNVDEVSRDAQKLKNVLEVVKAKSENKFPVPFGLQIAVRLVEEIESRRIGAGVVLKRVSSTLDKAAFREDWATRKEWINNVFRNSLAKLNLHEDQGGFEFSEDDSEPIEEIGLALMHEFRGCEFRRKSVQDSA